MKTIIINVLLFTLIVYGQKSQPNYPQCINITKYVYENVESLNDDSLIVFFKQFSMKDNKNNIEFREWGNEILFKVLEKKPVQFFENLFIMDTSEIKSIENEINFPIHDGINMIKLHKEIEGSKLDEKKKSLALNFIKPSFEAFKKLIEDWEKKNNKKWKN